MYTSSPLVWIHNLLFENVKLANVPSRLNRFNPTQTERWCSPHQDYLVSNLCLALSFRLK